MSRLYLIRHGRTAHNLARRIQGPLLDDPLDEVGRAQAAALATRFRALRDAGEAFTAVYASPMRRAVETAEPVARALALAPRLLAGLIEFSWGEYMGRVEEGDVEAFTAETVRRWASGEVDLAPPGGESPRAAGERAARELDRVARDHPDESIVVVAHGRINKIVLANLLHEDLSRMEDFPQFNTGVTLLEKPRGAPRASWRLAFLNDRAHLDDPLAGAKAEPGPARAAMHRHAQEAGPREARARREAEARAGSARPKGRAAREDRAAAESDEPA